MYVDFSSEANELEGEQTLVQDGWDLRILLHYLYTFT